MSQENIEVVQSAYAAISERGFDALAALIDPDWLFDFSRSIGPQRGVYRGGAEIARLVASTEEAFERFQTYADQVRRRHWRRNRHAPPPEHQRPKRRLGVG